jgi:alkanesulfonate monooxygenase SsuD/methylene tetrahydromethanopterin reductase-like flavin-dependent oxidoreductase (luciferase family)
LLFSEEPATFQGERFRLAGAYNRPAPAQPNGPPVWLGSKGGPRALTLAARLADGWNTVWRWTVEDYRERAAELERICEREGRDPATVRRSVGLYTLAGEDERDLDARFRALQQWAPGGSLDGTSVAQYARGGLVGTPAARFSDLGVEEIIVNAASVPFAVYDPSMLELFSEAVIRAA